MNPLWVILVLFLILIYILSPLDIVPDIIPLLGWLDDTFLVGLFVYYLRYRQLPAFVSKVIGFFSKKSGKIPGDDSSGFSSGGASKGGAAAKDPYEVLGVRPNATPEEIHAAYRLAARQYHPDKVAHLGEEFRELAQQKFVEIRKAYDILTHNHS